MTHLVANRPLIFTYGSVVFIVPVMMADIFNLITINFKTSRGLLSSSTYKYAKRTVF